MKIFRGNRNEAISTNDILRHLDFNGKFSLKGNWPLALSDYSVQLSMLGQ